MNVAAEPLRCGAGLGPQGERVILAVVDGVAKVQNIKECKRYGPNGTQCNACENVCPGQAIEFI